MGKPTISKFSNLFAAAIGSEKVKISIKNFMKGKFSEVKIDNNVNDIDYILSFKILLKILYKSTATTDGKKTVPRKILIWFE